MSHSRCMPTSMPVTGVRVLYFITCRPTMQAADRVFEGCWGQHWEGHHWAQQSSTLVMVSAGKLHARVSQVSKDRPSPGTLPHKAG